jgi:hypothetical protein
VVGFLVYAYLLYRQNKIMEEQNDLMREQGGAARRMANERTWIDTRWPMLAMAALTLVTWSAVGYDYYDRHKDLDLVALSRPSVIKNWGPVPPPGTSQSGLFPMDQLAFVEVVADGHALLSYADRFHVAAMAFHYDGTVDEDDVKPLKSNTFDIRDADMEIRIPVGGQYRNELLMGFKVTNYALMLLPKEVSVLEFDTIRQAKALGARVLYKAAGPP